MLRHSFAVLATLVAACGTSSSSSSSGSSGSGDGGGAPVSPFCHSPEELTVDGYRPKISTADDPQGAPTYRRHVKVGSCEGYLFSWVDEAAQRYDDWLVTNCAPASLGGPAAKNGLPADCMVDVSGGHRPDSGPPRIYYELSCVCCDGTQCGRWCHPVDFAGGGGVTCASYSYDFQSSVIADDPRTDPEHCDCTTEQ